jgi:hypothetical protein
MFRLYAFPFNIRKGLAAHAVACVLLARAQKREHFTGVRTHIKDVKMAEGNSGQAKFSWQLKRISVFRQVERNKGFSRSNLETFYK